MTTDNLGKLFGSVARVRLLRLFLFHPRQSFSAEDAVRRSRCALREVRKELNELLKAKAIRRINANRPRYALEARYPYLEALRNLLLTVPLREAGLQERFARAGAIKLIVLAGMLSGDSEGRLDLLIVGDRLRERTLQGIVRGLEADMGRELRYSAMDTRDFRYRQGVSDRLVRDVFDYPHRIAFNKLDISLQ